MCRISTNQWGNTRLSTMRLRVHVDRVGFPLNPGACVCVCVCCPAAQRRVIQMCVCELYALDKSTLSHVFGLHGIFTQTLFLFVVNAWCTL